ncbi:hypothetical protein ACFSYH_12995 [Populibacterium corticicola]|uniref:Copper chaperone PCu(A)C n=1 Tax=Populibacterium corticicola TaxID=1812826 RepID=A0ABW5XG72_9MICO
MFNPASRPLRVVAGAALAGGLVLGVTACAPSTTDLYYAASDGTRVTLDEGTVEVINLMILTSGEGGTAHVHGAIKNHTTDDNVASLVSEDGALNLQVELSSQQTVNLSNDDVAGTEIADFPAKPGSTLDVQLSDAAGNAKVVHVPVLDGTLPEYQDHAPTE